jgi:hypothetical protein
MAKAHASKAMRTEVVARGITAGLLFHSQRSWAAIYPGGGSAVYRFFDDRLGFA